ncbi:MAG: HAMP domain-containing histidine kinase [Acidimicrobiia bacterium]|nr:HAMP domain-containing histidine kinase [Acidimicrobiia bacterium]
MRRRLAIVTLGATALIVVSFLVPLGLLVRRQAEDRALSRAESDGRAVATAIAVAASFAAAPLDGPAVEAVLGAFGSPAGIGVFLPDGTVVGTGDPGDPDVGVARQGTAFTARTPDGAAVLVPVLTGGAVIVVRADVPTADLREGVTGAWLVLGLLAALLILVAIAAADRLGRSIVTPVASLRLATGALASGDLEARVVPSGPPEIIAVGKAFNDLAERLRGLLQAEREAAADISHGLRTPVAALRLQVESIPDRSIREALLDDVSALEASIGAVIREARSRGEEAPDHCDLARIVRERTAFWAVLAGEQGRPLTIDAPATLETHVTTRDATTVIDTLLENVFAHTAPPTAIRVTLSARGIRRRRRGWRVRSRRDSTRHQRWTLHRPGPRHRAPHRRTVRWLARRGALGSRRGPGGRRPGYPDALRGPAGPLRRSDTTRIVSRSWSCRRHRRGTRIRPHRDRRIRSRRASRPRGRPRRSNRRWW